MLDRPTTPTSSPATSNVELVGGALDGQLVDVTSWTPAERATGAMLITNDGTFGAGGRAEYEARLGEPGRWDWAGDVP
ncbi:hypothetical protein [Streptomyces sp. NPDC006510]|uniref:hypothetical protein n=1 Tax=Streptomyces sp. NPDC006510 TaxID=3155600 RepID=UPI00339E7D97